jgi:hypothetical protein
MADETALMKELQMAASQIGARLFRQNVGQGWIGKAERVQRARAVAVRPGDVVIRNARPFRTGIAGMSDLGGWVPVTITPEMVGKTVAVYAQVEVKDGARVTEEQAKWIAAVQKAGGLAGIARNISDLTGILTARAGSKD